MQFKNEKEPAECSGMEDVRAEIDRLDKTIIMLIGKRFQYVQGRPNSKPANHLFVPQKGSKPCFNNADFGHKNRG